MGPLRRVFIAVLSVALAALPLRTAQAEPWAAAAGLSEAPTPPPQAHVIRVSAADYPALAQRLQAAGYQPEGQAQSWQVAAAGQASQEAPASVAAPQQAGSDCDTSPPPPRESESSVGVNVHIGGHGGGSGNDAAVIFVIIGTVVVVMWTLYAVKYLVDRARGVDFCGRRWNEWSMSTSSISSYGLQYGNFTGLRYVGGVSPGGAGFGIGAELGQADVWLTSASATGALQLKGLYWLLGPVLRWQLSDSVNPSYLQMEFQAGSTANPEMGLIATARIGVNFGLGERLRLGLSYGAMSMKLHEQGVILDRSRFYALWGLDLGWRF